MDEILIQISNIVLINNFDETKLWEPINEYLKTICNQCEGLENIKKEGENIIIKLAYENQDYLLLINSNTQTYRVITEEEKIKLLQGKIEAYKNYFNTLN